ncbi:MAG: MarR family transcriptional regulator [Candidatus Krumholzibacteriota bacterium]|nr:MarR family transcriptional regulator [Candidatus Krumholzibacteriota bacterium]
MKKANIHYQADRLAKVFGDLVRAYQFRDRNEICCHDVTVSQCYMLEALDREGTMTMSELGDFLFLDISTISRVVDQLEDAVGSIGLNPVWGVTRFYDKIPAGTVTVAAWGVLDQMDGVDRERISRFFETYAGSLGPETIIC